MFKGFCSKTQKKKTTAQREKSRQKALAIQSRLRDMGIEVEVVFMADLGEYHAIATDPDARRKLLEMYGVL
jgi:uncharacterized protein with GYD domain